MIALSPRLVELMTAPVVNIFYLIKISDVMLTSYPADLNVNGHGIFISTNIIHGLDNLKASSTVDRDLYSIRFADSSFQLLPFYEGSVVGAPVEVAIGFVDYTTNTPDVDNLLLVYKGVVESFGYSVNTSEIGEVISEVTCSNPMADLDAVRPFYTSKDFIKQLDVDDTSFDQVYQGAGVINLLWGKV